LGRDRFHDLAAVRPFKIDVVAFRRCELAVEAAGVIDNGIDGEARIEHGNMGRARRRQKALDMRQGSPTGIAATQRVFRIVRPALFADHVILGVDDNERRPHAEAAAPCPIAAFDGRAVRVAQEVLPIRHARSHSLRSPKPNMAVRRLVSCQPATA
jgi:hypothetical protein